MMCCAKAVPRSKRSVTLVTRQPSFSSPTRFATGTRASSRNTSQKWLSPSMRAHRAHLDAGLVHVEDQPGDALVLRRVGVGAHEQLAVVGDVGAGAPDLLAVDDVLVAVAHRPGAQRREVGAGLRLGEALAPDALARAGCAAGGSARCSSVPSAISVGPACIMPTKLTLMYGASARGVLLEVDELLGDRQPATAELDRPLQPGVAGVVELALPAGVVGRGARASRRAAAAARAGTASSSQARTSRAERLVVVGVAQVHRSAPGRGAASRSSADGGEVDLARVGARQLVDDPDLGGQLVAGEHGARRARAGRRP